jgi:uncharacterized protein
MLLSSNILHIAKVIGLMLIVLMIWLTAKRVNSPARYANNQAKVTGNFEEGKAEGIWIWWYQNGTKMSEGEFINGKRNGTWQTWYSDGHKKSKATYVHDKLNGPYLSWFENGTIKSIRNYKDDLLNGLQQYYDTAEQLKEEKFYIDGKEKSKDSIDN